MKAWALPGSVILLAFFSTAALAQPKLQVVEGTKLDFGRIDRGDVIQKKITLKNAGNQVLTIGTVEASCGCTGTVVSEKNLPPGKTGTLLITFNSKNFSGPIHKTITVNSNSGGEPRTVVEFTGTVVEEVIVAPTQMMFRDAEIGKTYATSAKIKNQGKDPLSLTGYRVLTPGITLQLPQRPLAPSDSIQVTVEFRPTAVRPVLSDILYITTSSKKQSELMLYIFGNVKEFKFQ